MRKLGFNLIQEECPGGESSKPTNNQIVPLTQLVRIGDGSKIDEKESATEPKKTAGRLTEVRSSKRLLELLNNQQKSICLL